MRGLAGPFAPGSVITSTPVGGRSPPPASLVSRHSSVQPLPVLGGGVFHVFVQPHHPVQKPHLAQVDQSCAEQRRPPLEPHQPPDDEHPSLSLIYTSDAA